MSLLLVESFRTGPLGALRPRPESAGLMLRAVAVACVLLALQPADVRAQSASATPEPVRVLIEQSQYWQARGDRARARENWEKLLRISPNQPEALVGMAQLALDENQTDNAREYLRQLQSSHPESPLIVQLEQSIRVGGNRQQLESARALAQQGRSNEAVAEYRQALGGQAPTGDLALEYYQTLGGSVQGWEEARQGLERLAQADPGNGTKALALAQHLTYRENTRAEGIRRLSDLSRRPEISQQAIQSWRRALAWQGTGPAAIAAYQSYLQQNPDDQGVRTQLQQLQQQRQAQAQVQSQSVQQTRDPLRERSTAGFRALDQGDVAAAERDFQAVLASRPNDGDAQGGMGLIRLRQERFEEAQRLLQQASRGSDASRWRTALNSATYWTLVRRADTERNARNWPEAQRSLEQAVRIDPNELTGQNALADVLARSGQPAAAETAYRNILQRHPGNTDATRGLIGALSQNNKSAEALQLLEQLSPEEQRQLGSIGALRAERDLALAKQAQQRGDLTAARSSLERAMSNDPQSPWVRLDLARIYLQMGAPDQARNLMANMLTAGPATAESLYASALFASETADWPTTLSLLERIPAQNRTTDMGALQRRAWVHAQAKQATALAQQGRTQEAINLLNQARGFAGQDNELMGVVANGFSDAGQPALAIDMLRQSIVSTVRPQPGLWLQYAGILLKTGQDAELAGILQQLSTQPLNAEDDRTYQGLRVSYVVRQADALREAGDLAGAYDMLAPLLVQLPGNGDVIGALARMYADHGDYNQALQLYTRQRQSNPRDVPTLLAAASTATQAKEYSYAENALTAALQVAPQDPEVLAAAARVYRAQGKNSRAEQLYTAALQAQQRAAGGSIGLPTGQVSWSDARPRNPFRNATTGVASNSLTAAAAAGGRQNAGNPFAASSLQPAAGAYAGAYGGAPAQQPVYPPIASAGQNFIPAPVMAAPQGQAGYGGYPATAAQPYGAASMPSAYVAAPVARTAPAAATARTATANRRTATAAAPAAAPAQMAASLPQAYYGAAPAAQAYGQPAQPVYPQQAYPQNYAMPAQAGVYGAPAGYGAQPVYGGVQQPYGLPQQQQQQGLLASIFGDSDVPVQRAPATLAEELASLREERGATVSLGATLRTRQGEAGLGKLDDLETPFEVRVPAGNGKVVFNATMVSLDAGTPATATSLSSYDQASRFGGGPVAAYNSYLSATGGGRGISAGPQSDDGVGLSIGYESERWRADIGTTPIGFLYSTVVGGAQIEGPLNDQIDYKVGVSRRAVTDSLLSFAGAKDARTGDEWGGVVATGARAELGFETQPGQGFYGYGSYHTLNGHNVASNSRFEGGGGMYWRLIDEPNRTLSSGLNVTMLGFGKNRRYFTYGHGGYFSPQNFLSVGVPVDWTGRSSRLSYRVQGSVGLQHFKEDAANFFPTSSARQGAAFEAAQTAGGLTELGDDAARARYAGQTKTGLGYNVGGSLEYKIGPQLFVGGHLAFDNASDYRQMTGGVYLRYALEPQTRAMAMPVNPLKSPYAPY